MKIDFKKIIEFTIYCVVIVISSSLLIWLISEILGAKSVYDTLTNLGSFIAGLIGFGGVIWLIWNQNKTTEKSIDADFKQLEISSFNIEKNRAVTSMATLISQVNEISLILNKAEYSAKDIIKILDGPEREVKSLYFFVSKYHKTEEKYFNFLIELFSFIRGWVELLEELDNDRNHQKLIDKVKGHLNESLKSLNNPSAMSLLDSPSNIDLKALQDMGLDQVDAVNIISQITDLRLKETALKQHKVYRVLQIKMIEIKRLTAYQNALYFFVNNDNDVGKELKSILYKSINIEIDASSSIHSIGAIRTLVADVNNKNCIVEKEIMMLESDK